MTDIDIDATRQTPEVAEPGNNTFAVWFDQNRDPFLTFYREDAYASDKVRWFNADQYDTGDDDGPKSWAALCELAEGMKGPELLVPGAKVDELTAALTQSRAQAATYANEIGTLTAENARLRQQRDGQTAVVEAAKAWRAEREAVRVGSGTVLALSGLLTALAAAVDALPKAEATR